MEGQYCLKWNNHHSTLISVLDSLLGSGKHVDCTLAAEGRELGAHKVVLSACSPYLESLLNKPSEKHPIIIFNDVKYDELKAILEYMYRGEVNVLQEQLARFLKAAEALQIKGLTDQGGGGGGGSNDNDHRGAGNIESLASNQIGGKYKHASETSSEDTTTPSRNMRQEDHAPNRRKRQRRMSQEKLSSDNNIDSSNSCDTILSAPITATTAVHSQPTSVTKIETDRLSSPMVQQQHNTSAPPTTAVLIKEKLEPPEMLLQPKSEYFEDPNSQDKFIEDLTLDDDEEVSRYSAKPGPSHADTQEYNTSWHLGDRSVEDSFLSAQDVMGNQSNSQGAPSWPDFNPLVEVVMGAVSEMEEKGTTLGLIPRKERRDLTQPTEVIVNEERFECQTCGRSYKHFFHLKAHRRECSVEPLFRCEECHKRFYHSRNLGRHMQNVHKLKKKTSDIIGQQQQGSVMAPVATATTN